MSEQIRREFTLPFPIENIKKAIEDSCLTSQGSYSIKEKNEVFGSYSMLLVKNLFWLPVTITLKKASETETQFELSAIPGPKLTRMSTFTSELIEAFLKRVGDYASGRYVVQPPAPRPQVAQAQLPPEPTKAVPAYPGILILLTALALLAGALYYIYHH